MKSGTYEEWSKLLIAKTVTPKVNDSDYFIIDEISFISCEFFNYINKIFQSVKQNQKPFGGVGKLLFGDFFQHQTVIPQNLYDSSERLFLL
jgi:hypothetical protein